MEFIPIVIFWFLVIFSFFRPSYLQIYLFFSSIPFGTFAVIPTAFTAGLTFTPTPMIAIFIILRAIVSPTQFKYLIHIAFSLRGMLLLVAFGIVTALTTIFVPRFFQGAVEIIPMRSSIFMRSDVLTPTPQNISQLVYLWVSIASVGALAVLMTDKINHQHGLRALYLGAGITLLTGVLDFATQYLPIKPLLEPFRTATYALLTEVEVLNAKRVVGLMPEASSFGSICISFLSAIYFFRRAVISAILRTIWTPLLLGGLLLFTWLSTSSSSYVSLAILLGVAFLEWFWRFTSRYSASTLSRGLSLEFTVALIVASSALVVVVLSPALLDPMVSMLDRMVFQKTSSSSFTERNFWTTTSFNALMDTYGLGVGMGGTRASNSFVAVISNTGILGGLLYFGYVAMTLLRSTKSRDPIDLALMNAVRWAFIPGFCSSLLVGVSADFGLFNSWLFAVALAAYARGFISRGTYSLAHPLAQDAKPVTQF